MKTTIGAEITIEEPTNEILDYAKENLVFKNPTYIMHEKLGKSNWNTPKEVVLYKRIANKIVLPFGVVKDVYPLIKGTEINSEFKRIACEKKCCDIILRPYQKRALESVKNAKGGILVAPCGSGKTLIGLNLANDLQERTLWIAHTLDLVNQAKENYVKHFMYLKSGDVGTISEGKVNIGNVITFATIQTLRSIDIEKLKNEFGVIIIDECHHLAMKPDTITMYAYVMNRLNCRYKFGLTATPKRKDGLEKTMYALVGKKAHEITQHEVDNCKVPSTLEVIDLPTEQSREYQRTDHTLDNVKLSSYLATHIGRNARITNNIVKKYLEGGHRQLVLCERVAQVGLLISNLDEMNKQLDKPMSIAVFTGEIKKSQREKILSEYLNIDVIVATYQIASEGLDMPALDILHLASPKTKNNKALITQCVGRVERQYEGKEKATVYFYRDYNILFCQRACENIRLAMKIKKRDFIFNVGGNYGN